MILGKQLVKLGVYLYYCVSQFPSHKEGKPTIGTGSIIHFLYLVRPQCMEKWWENKDKTCPLVSRYMVWPMDVVQLG